MKKIATLLLCLLLATSAMAQLKKSRIGSNSNQHISLGVGASYPVFDCSGAIGGAAQLSYTYYFMPRLGLRGEASYAYLRYEPSASGPSTSSGTEIRHAIYGYQFTRGAG